MNGSVRSARLNVSRRACLLVLAAVVSGAPAAVTWGGVTSSAIAATARSGPALYCGCYSPHQFDVAYGIQPLLDSGTDGRGETVTVLVTVPQPNHGPAGPGPAPGTVGTDIRQDMKGFDSMFGLPAPRIEVVTSPAGSASPWQATLEEVTDTEIVHAVAPAATLRVVLVSAKTTAQMVAGLRLAVSHTDVASISAALGEHYFTKVQVAEIHSMLVGAEAHHVTVVAATGDSAWHSDPVLGGPAVKEVSLPASDPLVLGVGGSTLTVNPSTGAYVSETAWEPSGGGFSHLYARPSYQEGVPGISKTRGVPEVAGDAGKTGGIARVVVSGGVASLVWPAGTSDSAPLWGGIVALADQYAHHDLGFINPAIYRIGLGSSYHRAFRDITTGSNGYPAGPGWDPVTGWGTPDAQVLVPLLAR